MKYVNIMTGEVCKSIWHCIRNYWLDRKQFGFKSWTWMRLDEFDAQIDQIIFK